MFQAVEAYEIKLRDFSDTRITAVGIFDVLALISEVEDRATPSILRGEHSKWFKPSRDCRCDRVCAPISRVTRSGASDV